MANFINFRNADRDFGFAKSSVGRIDRYRISLWLQFGSQDKHCQAALGERTGLTEPVTKCFGILGMFFSFSFSLSPLRMLPDGAKVRWQYFSTASESNENEGPPLLSRKCFTFYFYCASIVSFPFLALYCWYLSINTKCHVLLLPK